MKRQYVLPGLCALSAGAILNVNSAVAAVPEIDVQHKGDKITLTFTGTLQESADAINWTTVDASSPYEVTIAGGIKFYRAMGEGGVMPGTWTAYCSDTVTMVLNLCSAGTFTMGSPEDELGRKDGETQHQVTLSKPFWMGKYEVTQAQYEALTGENPSLFKGDNLPVDQVSWYDAVDFCSKLTEKEKAAGRLPAGYVYSLPTEAQWEYACRAGMTTAFNNGKNIPTEGQAEEEPCPNLDEVGWYWYNSDETTHPVGLKKPNAWGLYDMHGNVDEWCLDWKGDYPDSAVTDPEGPESGLFRVKRGGSWPSYASGCRSGNRLGFFPDLGIDYDGFRVALVPEK